MKPERDPRQHDDQTRRNVDLDDVVAETTHEVELARQPRVITYTSHQLQLTASQPQNLTRKLSYRKDDRAMRPIYGCPEKFQESLSTPIATFSEIFNGLLF